MAGLEEEMLSAGRAAEETHSSQAVGGSAEVPTLSAAEALYGSIESNETPTNSDVGKGLNGVETEPVVGDSSELDSPLTENI
jgi:hypothetical protein